MRHLRVGGVGIDAAVTAAFLAALAPAGLGACLAAAAQLEHGVDAALAQWRREVERARYQAAKAQRRYLAVDPDNRLVARGLEADWEQALRTLADAEAELRRREAQQPKTLTPQEETAILALGADIGAVWDAATTTDRRLDLPSLRRQGRPKDCSASFSNPILERPWCRFEEKREPAYYRLLRHLLSEKLQASYKEDRARPLPPRMVDLLKTLEQRRPPETHKTLAQS